MPEWIVPSAEWQVLPYSVEKLEKSERLFVWRKPKHSKLALVLQS